MADDADCDVDPTRSCPVEAPPENELDDPSILPATDAGPVLAGPLVVTGTLTPCDIGYLQSNFRPLKNFTDPAAADAAAVRYDTESQAAPSEIEQRKDEGFVEPDEVSSNITEEITNIRDSNPLSYSFQIMAYIEYQIKTHLLGPFDAVFNTLYDGLLGCVPDLGANTIKGFVGITRCGFLSKYTTVIYYAGRIPYNYRMAIVTLIEQCNQKIKEHIEKWLFNGITFTCKYEKSLVQYDTQKIILGIRLPTRNVIQIPILNVVGFPVFEDVTLLLQLLGCVNPPSLPCFFTPQLAYDFIGRYPDLFTAFIASQQHGQSIAYAFIIGHPTLFTEFIGLRPDALSIASDFIIGHPTQFTQFIGSRPDAQRIASDFIIGHPTQFTQFIGSHSDALSIAYAFIIGHPTQFTQFITSRHDAQSIASDFIAANPQVFTRFITLRQDGIRIASDFIAANPQVFTQFIALQPRASCELQSLSLLDIIVRVRLCANQGAITALSEPSKEEVTLILSCFQGLIPQDVLLALMSGDMNASAAAATAIAAHINAITQTIRQILYTDANIKPFALFCNIFYNFINVSLGFRSLAKIIYSDFFGTSDNYGKVIRTCQVVNRLPIMNERVKFFLTGSNAARVYLALNDIIKLGATISLDTIAPILSKTFGNLSDNDFMIYLKREVDEPYRVFIRMILGGSFYFFKELFNAGILVNFTEMMIQSVGIVGYMDHLFAQRFDASTACLHRCYGKDPNSFLAQIFLSMQTYFHELDKQINVAHFDGVFKHYTLKKFYDEIFHICGYIEEPPLYVYDFLINHATSINCIATVWTLVLNVLYTLFVPENCLARIVVGKFDNDPKNLKLYMEILNDHLTELQSLQSQAYGIQTHVGSYLSSLIELQTKIVVNCETGINRGPDELNVFKQTCSDWVLTMVTAVSQHVGRSEFKGLFMLNETDADGQGSRYPTRLERALCLAYLPTSRGNICSAASPTGPHIFREQILKIVDLETTYINSILSSDMFRRDASEGVGQALLERLKKCGVNDGNLDAFLILPSDTMEKKPFKLEKELSEIFKKTCLEAPRKPLISLSGTDNLAKILTSLTGNSADTTTLLERLKHFGVNDDNLNALGNVEVSIIEKTFSMSDQLAKAFIGLCQQQLPIAGIMDKFEIDLHEKLTKMGLQIYVHLEACKAYNIEIKPEGTLQLLSTYLNFMWKHLTKNAIDLKIFFKENLSDIKRVTGIKYIALVLGGYFQIRLLIDDVFVPGTFETFTRNHTMAATMAEWRKCKRGLLPLLIEPPLRALVAYIFHLDAGREIKDDPDPIPRILKILGFLFSIKVKSSSPHSPYNLLRIGDSMIIFPFQKDPPDPKGLQILNPKTGMFIKFLIALGVPNTKEIMKCICREGGKTAVEQIDSLMLAELTASNSMALYEATGGSNDSYSNSGRKSVSSLNKHKHKYKHNKLARNNRTHRNKKNRKKNSKSKSRKSKSKSKSCKSRRKNVTFKRRKRSNRH